MASGDVSRKDAKAQRAELMAWIKAMRLRTLPLSFASVLMGSFYAFIFKAIGAIFGGEFLFDWIIFVMCIVTTLLLQILSNFANDYGDFVKGTDNANRVGPERALQSGQISTGAMKSAIIIVAILSLVSGIILLIQAFGLSNFLASGLFLVLGLAAIAAAIKYTVGKRAYGYAGLGDVAVMIFFGFVGVIGPFCLLIGQFSLGMVCLALTMGCFAVAVLNLNNMRDIVGDALASKKTIPVRLGFKKAKIYHLGLFLLGWSSFYFGIVLPMGAEGLAAIGILPFMIHVLHLIYVFRTKEPAQLDGQLKLVSLTSFLFAMLHWGILLF